MAKGGYYESDHKEIRDVSWGDTALTFFTFGLGAFAPNSGDVVGHEVTIKNGDGDTFTGSASTREAATTLAILAATKSK